MKIKIISKPDYPPKPIRCPVCHRELHSCKWGRNTCSYCGCVFEVSK